MAMTLQEWNNGTTERVAVKSAQKQTSTVTISRSTPPGDTVLIRFYGAVDIHYTVVAGDRLFSVATGEAQANSAMHILSALLNFAAANYEIDGKPIILSNPVKRLSNNRRWYPEHRRQGVVPDHKLPDWFASVFALRHQTVRDYLLLMLLTRLRRSEAATLKWTDIDFASRVLTVRAEVAKNGHELRLPLSNCLERLLQNRFATRGDSLYVFPGHGKKLHLVDSKYVIEGSPKTSAIVSLLTTCAERF